MKLKSMIGLSIVALFLASCVNGKSEKTLEAITVKDTLQFNYNVEQFADIKILRYQIPGWEQLTLKEQKLAYYLTQAGLAGRDIIWDQNYRYNLTIRTALESIYKQYNGDKSTEEWKAFETYLKRIWFSNGIHHHYSNDKIKPEFSSDYLKQLLADTNTVLEGDAFEVIFNEADAKKVNQAKGVDNVALSAVNMYGPNVTNDDVINFYKNKKSPDATKPLSFGLNSQLVKENGVLKERVYKSGGLYGSAIDEIIKWLELAKGVAENEAQAHAFGLLIDYYKTGDLQTWDDYNVAWTKSTNGNIDYINSFIEVYYDPIGYRGYYESIIQINDFDMSKKMKVVSDNAQWFEDNSPLMEEHKKENVVGVTYKVVNVVGEAGGASPSTPIGVNLPNANWIRASVGSKSVSLGNIIEAYNNAASSGRLKEFVNDEEELQLGENYGQIADKLHTALHEVIGHASGKLNPGVGETKETLKNYASTLEEGRADLVALYYLYDSKLQELGLVDDWEKVGKEAYDSYIRNGLLTQLIRLNLGDDVEEAHMRNRQWVAAWVFEKGKADKVIEKITRDGKTYFNINDYAKLRDLFGQLLRETQRIKSEGDYAAVETLVETYGVKVDQAIHAEVLERNKQFTSAPYSGFVNPVLVTETNDAGDITAIKVTQPETFSGQMLDYSKNYHFLPEIN
ncbi:MAG: dihydrofolate reductase [Flavobacteriales bacterium]|nr:dihydrofolate reductase [Flavobacteriia bacterium]NCP06463.1 dihydrofolate reductase [Flavobacteriales bacterium]PIV94999.1 MAG: dihydrofolate reductase [Flavobacteriaceae bacterium CG17_big_fil_post_rev_8_21_14_2_50_33_15]PIY12611.1 MAG: dihydrofolate reductase [Flavobacteriaceae bacterium CG_4_10_14_3_um_filter_33_47]PJB16327.1 MAG: dihydrofolate reductase [Flavobacteriaceae bacterium CG_4_9_14_3_um_filter_33_16]